MAIRENNPACCGCGACADICPKQAITLREDGETFRFPVVDSALCVECGLCERTCPMIDPPLTDPSGVRAFVGVHGSGSVVDASASGGAFSALCEYYVGEGFAVYGARYDESLQVAHVRAATPEACEALRKSKYVQSDTVGVFRSVERDLRAGQSVLFSGTSCQCAALRLYCEAKRLDTRGLVTVNVLCRGVPSQALFNAYLAEVHPAAVSYEFRYRRRAGGQIDPRAARITDADGGIRIATIATDPYLRGYYNQLFCRTSCIACPFAAPGRATDITLGDAWRINTIKPGYEPDAGVSLILYNTEKGAAAMNFVNGKLHAQPVETDWVFRSQPIFSHPTRPHRNREEFFRLLPVLGFKKAVFRCARLTLPQRIWRYTPPFAKRVLKRVLKR